MVGGMNFGEPRDIGNMRFITPAVKYLLILNIAIFYIEFLFGFPLRHWFSLQSEWMSQLKFGQLFTYMFVHANFSHLLMNMITLFFIGPTVEKTIGSYRFFILYYLSGLLGGLGWSLLAPPETSCLGASGAIMGVLGAFGAFYPNSTILLWFVLPVKTWILVLGLVLWELYETIHSPLIGGIANAAHLMGCIAGIVYALSLKHPRFFRRKSTPFSAPSPEGFSREEIDQILEKIGREGMGALTPQERERLKRATRG